ncbi:MAG: hypothetical protein WC460_05720 [Patescibacteria group bacterium]
MFKHRGNNKIWIIFSIFLITIIFVLPENSKASSLSALSDRMNRQAPLVAANHEIKFNTPGGIGESGQYLRIIFDSGFNLSAITFADIDLLHGPITGLETNETLASSANATNWGITISGSHLDLMHPTDNANGDILPNDKVVIRIGLNANGGSHQIINPATIGSKIITLSGNYGDSGKLAVAIFVDQIGVGGQTAGAPPNPVILSEAEYTQTLSAILNWTQNIDLDFERYEVYMSETPGLTNLTGDLVATFNNRTQTTYTINDLDVNEDYYFKVYVYDTESLFAPSNEVHGFITGGGHIYPPRPAMPTLDARACPIFLPTATLSGTKPDNTIIQINDLSGIINYPTQTTWNTLVNLILGNNLFLIFARDSYGQNSDILNATVVRSKTGDTNNDGKIDDFDLAGLAYHWQANWCYADFNEDSIVDDFDLSGLAAHWDGIY